MAVFCCVCEDDLKRLADQCVSFMPTKTICNIIFTPPLKTPRHLTQLSMYTNNYRKNAILFYSMLTSLI